MLYLIIRKQILSLFIIFFAVTAQAVFAHAVSLGMSGVDFQIKEIKAVSSPSLLISTPLSSFSITQSGNNWEITANGIPLHPLAQSAYVNTYAAQAYHITLTTTPAIDTITELAAEFPKAFGITLDGVKLDPLTAECYDANGNRIRNPATCLYRQDALQTFSDLGFDEYYGHVQPHSGAYHYHAYSEAAAREIYKKYTGVYPTTDAPLNGMVLIGLARDGFPIYYILSGGLPHSSAYVLKSFPNRYDFLNKVSPVAPTGLYIQDYEYNNSAGELDECNGIANSESSPIILPDYSAYSGGFTLTSEMKKYFYVVNNRFHSDGTTPNFPAIGHCFKTALSPADGFYKSRARAR